MHTEFFSVCSVKVAQSMRNIVCHRTMSDLSATGRNFGFTCHNDRLLVKFCSIFNNVID